MNILKWIGAVVLFFWILGIIFRIGGMFIHWLLVIAAIVFIVDFFMGKKTLQ
ncbi:lmo0937 family membrane protein [Clostridium hydrogenum]|uniref:lmo0937 family membrane protein n=1 Tax=Clostridium hydrogenum TaxID=2855764 RepID=UPI001F1F544C|nr:lmo0937 family membrane protein [Clostridium hydrogenum]